MFRTGKRHASKMIGASSNKTSPKKYQIIASRSLPSVVCSYYHKTQHVKEEYRKTYGLCLICGTVDHLKSNCQQKKSVEVNHARNT